MPCCLASEPWWEKREAVAGNILTKIEGVGTKQLGDAFCKTNNRLMNKFRSIALESKRLGDPEATTIKSKA